MRMKRPHVLTIYRSTPEARPSALLDARILKAAREAVHHAPDRGALVFAGAMAATVLVAFTVRWNSTDTLTASDTRPYGVAEGQARDYLLKFDPQITGPGSQEGLP